MGLFITLVFSIKKMNKYIYAHTLFNEADSCLCCINEVSLLVFLCQTYFCCISVEDNKFIKEPVKFSNQATTFEQAFSDFFPGSKKGSPFIFCSI